jgi:deoxyribose-phosphate aldolase
MKFEDWIKTETGKKCLDISTLTSEEYLKNRLWRAFITGTESGEIPTISKMQKVVYNAHQKLGKLRKENKELRKQLSKSNEK